jgi:hypothetical protein
LENELAGWIRALPTPEEKVELTNPVLLACRAGLRVRLDEGGGWLVEVRSELNKPWRAPTQRWLSELATLRPADFEPLPPAEAALGAALAVECRLAPAGLSNRRPLPVAAVAGLLGVAAVRGALARPDGTPLVLEEQPLAPEAALSAERPDQLDLRLVTPDGRVVEPVVLATLRPEPLYLFAGRVWRGPAPGPSARLPVAALTDPRLMPRLRAAGLRLPAGLGADVRVVALKPRLKCWLAPAPDGREREFSAQLLAVAAEPPCAQQWAGETGWRWGKDSTPPPVLAGAPLLEFDLAAARVASARFGGLDLIWDGWA